MTHQLVLAADLLWNLDPLAKFFALNGATKKFNRALRITNDLHQHRSRHGMRVDGAAFNMQNESGSWQIHLAGKKGKQPKTA